MFFISGGNSISPFKCSTFIQATTIFVIQIYLVELSSCNLSNCTLIKISTYSKYSFIESGLLVIIFDFMNFWE